MSIINDALKKVQANLKNNPSAISPVKPQPYEDAPKRTFTSTPSLTVKTQTEKPVSPQPQSSELSFFILTVLILIIGVGIYLSINPPANMFQKTTPPQTIKEVIVPSPVAVAVPAPTVAPQQQATTNLPPQGDQPLVLSGIALGGPQNTALINGRMYKVGDTVQGKTIVNITADNVELTEDGKTITLTIN